MAQLGDKPFLVGAQFTIADCYLFVMLSWATMMGIALPQPLVAYLARTKELPAVASTLRAEGLA